MAAWVPKQEQLIPRRATGCRGLPSLGPKPPDLGHCACVCAKSLQSCLTLGNPVDCSLPGSLGFPRQEYWSGLPCPPPGESF